MKYQMLEKDRARYVSLILLNEIIQFQNYFPVVPVGEQVFIEPYLRGMYDKGLLRIDRGTYVPTELGREELTTLYAKYTEFLKMFDIFCAVDLERGEFAFSSMFEEFTEEEWFNFLQEERFSDVRVAVADFKGINPIELVFLSFLNENRFDLTQPRWENYLTSNGIWDEIVEICNTAVDVDYLKADGVLENVITRGSALAIDLVRRVDEMEQDLAEEEEVVEETIITTETTEYVDVVEMPVYDYDYWDYYYDPYYVSPIWLVPILLW